MNKMIVTVFANEQNAYEGFEALRELDREGSIRLHGGAVIAKDSKGKVTIKQETNGDLLGTGAGLATGTLIGLLGGPVGVAVGASTGAITGGLYDLAQLGVGNDYVDEVSKRLSPGKVADIAEIDEEWVTPLDTRMDALGGVVFRRSRAEFIDEQIKREVAADKAELAKLRAEYNQAVGEAKAKLQAKMEAVQKRLRARRDLLLQKLEAIKHEGEAKIKSLEGQLAKAHNDAKAKLEKRIAELRADHEARVAKLSQAWELIKEAAAL